VENPRISPALASEHRAAGGEKVSRIYKRARESRMVCAM